MIDRTINNKISFVGLIVLSGLVLTTLRYSGIGQGSAGTGTELTSVYTEGKIPTMDPASPLWKKASAVTIPISGQTTVKPFRDLPSVDSVTVESLNNGTHIAFRVTWEDDERNDRTTKDQEFRDALAIQVADKSAMPFVCMGSADVKIGSGGERMHIMQWKADWQKDIDEGFQDLEDSYPNFWVDYYPYAVGEPPYSVPENFPGNASQYLVGYHVGNPFSDPLKVTSVEDALAEGYGTIATQASQDAIGRGVWRNASWSVVVGRSLDTGDPDDTVIEEKNILAFAVWNGENHDVGSRKSVSSWVELRIRAGTREETPPYIAQICIFLLYVIALAAVVGLVAYGLKRRRTGKSTGEDEKKEGSDEEEGMGVKAEEIGL